MIQWHHPEYLFLLFAMPVLWVITIWLRRRRARLLETMADKDRWPVLLPDYAPRRQRNAQRARLLALVLLLTASARPQWGFRWEKTSPRGLDLLVALDTSRSMLAQDIKPNRLQQARWGIRDLVSQLTGDRIGLIAFAGDAFLVCPATADYAAFSMMLDDVYAGIIPTGGTDLSLALETALASFEPGTAADKVLILISDGESHTGDPTKLIPRLQQEGIRVFAIGVGTSEGEPILTEDGFVKDRNGHVVKSALDEQILERIARETGGDYVRSAPGDFGMERIYQRIEPLQRTQRESRMSKVWIERFPWFLGAALLLLAIEASVGVKRRRNSPR